MGPLFMKTTPAYTEVPARSEVNQRLLDKSVI